MYMMTMTMTMNLFPKCTCSTIYIVSAHFTSPNHNRLEDVKIFVLAFIQTPCTSAISKTQRLHEEALWQHRLHSLAPHGLNTLDENRAH